MLDWSPTPGSDFLLKPNMLNSKRAEEGVTTDPGLVAGLVKILREKGCKAYVGDSPSNAYPGKSRLVFETTGMMKSLEESGGQFLDFESEPPAVVDVGGELVSTLPFTKHVLEHKIINMPKLKTHVQTVMTGAVKNLAFGCVQGASKSKLHSIGNTPERMAKAIADVYAFLRGRVEFNLMDAIVCMDGNGPSFGRPRRELRLLASRDAVALDAVAFRMAGIDPDSVPHVRECMDRGLGPSCEEKIEIVGGPVPDLGFKLPSTILSSISLRFGSFAKRLGPQVFVNKKLCTRCGECIGICPEGAISMCDYPEVDDSKCIRCFACYEVCEHNSVEIRKRGIPF